MLDQLKKFLSNDKIKVIIFGETHGFIDDNKYQEKIIKIFKPSIFLYEMLETESLLTKKQIEDFLSRKNNEDFSIISKFGELKKTVRLAAKYNMPIVGIDFRNMLRKDKNFLKKRKLKKEDLRVEKNILRKREKRHVERILQISKKEKKVFVSLGVYHLRKDSPLLKIPLKYLVIYPTYNKKRIFCPPKNFKIKNLGFSIKKISNE